MELLVGDSARPGRADVPAAQRRPHPAHRVQERDHARDQRGAYARLLPTFAVSITSDSLSGPVGDSAQVSPVRDAARHDAILPGVHQQLGGHRHRRGREQAAARPQADARHDQSGREGQRERRVVQHSNQSSHRER